MKRSKIIRQLVIGITLLIVFPILLSALFAGKFQFRCIPVYFKESFFGITIGLLLWLGNWFIGVQTGKRLNWKKDAGRANTISLICFLSYGLIISVFVSYFFQHFIWDNSGRELYVNVIINAFIALAIDLIFISFFYSAYLAKYYKMALEQNEQLKHENLRARYESLKNQVNPHFLFNSLNTLTGLVEQKPALATGYIKKLSDTYRYVLEQSDKELISLKDELKFVDDYIYLLKIRFGDSLEFHSDIVVHNLIMVIPLGLQMLIENANKHNVISDNMPLKIEIVQEEEFISVKNNIQKKQVVAPQNKPFGLENLKNRYSYLTDIPVIIEESENEFMVKLPIIKSDAK